MDDSGINSFEEFLFFYFVAGFIIGLLWGVLEAHVLLGPFATTTRRHAWRLRLTRWLAPFGIAHVAFALVALAACQPPSDAPMVPEIASRAHCAAREARVFLVLGLVAVVLLASPHLPVLQDVPRLTVLGERAPWE